LIFDDLVPDPSHCMHHSCRVLDISEVCVYLVPHVYNCSGGAIGVFPQLLFPLLQVCNLSYPPLLINSPQLLFPSLQAITSSTGYEPQALGTSPIIALLPLASACVQSTPHLTLITFDLHDLCITLIGDTLSVANLTIQPCHPTQVITTRSNLSPQPTPPDGSRKCLPGFTKRAGGELSTESAFALGKNMQHL